MSHRYHRACGWLVSCLLFAAGCADPAEPEGGETGERNAARGTPLAWGPPELDDPETVELTSDDAHARLESERDYIVELTEPIEAVGGVIISGGRNVVLVGGHITIPWAGDDPSGADRRGLFLRWQSGTIHVEGLLIDNQGGDLSEGIQLNAPNAIVQLVNIRVEDIHARDMDDFTDNHPDIIQPWGGAKELRVNRLTGTTTYQGIFLKADMNELGRVRLHQVNLIGLPRSRYLLWVTDDVELADVEDVWVQPAPGRSYRITVRPEPPDRTWEDVHLGIPPGGDFVTAEDVGVDYQSPGYLRVDVEAEAA